jgi:hypothetical protein
VYLFYTFATNYNNLKLFKLPNHEGYTVTFIY